MNRAASGAWEIYLMALNSPDREVINVSENLPPASYAGKGDVFPVFHPKGDGLVFQSDRDGNWDIYKLEVQNSDNQWDIGKLKSLHSDRLQPTRLTQHPSRDAQPDVDREGRIIFESERTGNYDLWQMDWDGQDLKPLTTDSADDQVPAFGPFGKRIIFQSKRDGNWNLFALDLDVALTPTPTVTPTVTPSPRP